MEAMNFGCASFLTRWRLPAMKKNLWKPRWKQGRHTGQVSGKKAPVLPMHLKKPKREPGMPWRDTLTRSEAVTLPGKPDPSTGLKHPVIWQSCNSPFRSIPKKPAGHRLPGQKYCPTVLLFQPSAKKMANLWRHCHPWLVGMCPIPLLLGLILHNLKPDLEGIK
ncbi:hypothetical protein DSECCO2_348880 [anaerobic digester metagenome]